MPWAGMEVWASSTTGATDMNNQNHPIWSLARLVVYMAGLVTILAFTASDFDSTELKTILTMFFIGAGAEGATSFVGGLKRKSDG